MQIKFLIMDLLKKEKEEELKHKDLTERIIAYFYRVYNDLGYGFLERVYQNALYYALIDAGLKCEPEKSIKVYHNNRIVGDFRADLLVEDVVMLELKANETMNSADEAQLTNYLKATDIEVGLLLNFGRRPQFKRKVFSNDNK
jgi:GxxExxY protein